MRTEKLINYSTRLDELSNSEICKYYFVLLSLNEDLTIFNPLQKEINFLFLLTV